MFRRLLPKDKSRTHGLGFWDNVALSFENETGGGGAVGDKEYETIPNGGNHVGHWIDVRPCNQFTLSLCIQSLAGGGNSLSRILVEANIYHDWKPAAVADRDIIFSFDILNGAIVRNTHLCYTFGVYSNTTIDLLASGAPYYGAQLRITIFNTDIVIQEYTPFLQGVSLQGNQYDLGHVNY